MPRGNKNFSDPTKPKGRMNAYAFFLKVCREEHKKKFPDESVNFQEFSRRCADKWKTMSDGEKSRFIGMAETDKSRYDLEMQSYNPPPGEKGGRGKKRKVAKDPNAPKRFISAFFWFCNDQRDRIKQANPSLTVGSIAKELGSLWRVVEEDTKQKYVAMAAKDKARYEREMSVYNSNQGRPQAVRNNSNSNNNNFVPQQQFMQYPDEEYYEDGDDENEDE